MKPYVVATIKMDAFQHSYVGCSSLGLLDNVDFCNYTSIPMQKLDLLNENIFLSICPSVMFILENSAAQSQWPITHQVISDIQQAWKNSTVETSF